MDKTLFICYVMVCRIFVKISIIGFVAYLILFINVVDYDVNVTNSAVIIVFMLIANQLLS